MFEPWITIPVEDARVVVDYGVGDIRILFKDPDAVDHAIEALQELMELINTGRVSL
jgi:hypothetical protein